MPSIYLVLLTYDRLDYAVTTLRSALENIKCSSPLSVHIADDGSSEVYRQTLADIAGGYPQVQGVTVTDAERGGYGKSYNLAMQVAHQFAEVVLPLEDDWQLVGSLNLDPLIAALAEGNIGCIRMGYLGWTQELRGKFIRAAGQNFLALDPDSPEPHVWAGHPRLETREWQRQVGPWPEDEPSPGTTEFIVAHRKEARQGVVWPVDLISPIGDTFVHIGSVQARTDQREEAIA